MKTALILVLSCLSLKGHAQNTLSIGVGSGTYADWFWEPQTNFVACDFWQFNQHVVGLTFEYNFAQEFYDYRHRYNSPPNFIQLYETPMIRFFYNASLSYRIAKWRRVNVFAGGSLLWGSEDRGTQQSFDVILENYKIFSPGAHVMLDVPIVQGRKFSADAYIKGQINYRETSQLNIGVLFGKKVW